MLGEAQEVQLKRDSWRLKSNHQSVVLLAGQEQERTKELFHRAVIAFQKRLEERARGPFGTHPRAISRTFRNNHDTFEIIVYLG